MPSDTLGVLLLSGSHDRVHYAFVLASGAAAIGRDVVIFASNRGCLGLCRDWSGLDDAARDTRVRASGVAGLEELRDAAVELGVRLIACESGMRIEAIDADLLLPGVEVAGVVTFLSEARGGQIVTL